MRCMCSCLFFLHRKINNLEQKETGAQLENPSGEEAEAHSPAEK